MRKKGWLTVTAAESGYKHELGLTRQGKTLLEASVPAWEDAQGRARAVLGQRGSDSIYSVANAVRSGIGGG